MKIKTKKVSYDYVASLSLPKRKKPARPWLTLGALIRLLSIGELKSVNFKYTKERMDEAGKGPYFILMNHSAFIDLKIAFKIFYPKPFHVICTSDGFVGKEWLMRHIGCIPAQKFVTDLPLLSDIIHVICDKKRSVLMYPEASYSFDGTATTLQKGLGKLLKKLNVPVVTIITEGAFLHDPLYNGLQLRKTPVTAKVKCLFTKEDLKNMTVEELDEALAKTFTFDGFKHQQETKTKIDVPFRADGLERILYRCTECNSEGQTVGKGTTITCKKCGKTHVLDEFGFLSATDGNTKFSHIPDWYAWQRECVKEEILNGTYRLDAPVEIGILKDTKAIYMVGDGNLKHDQNGFTLTGCDGKLNYTQSPLSSYGLYADYFWYEIGDVICIGDRQMLYYCFPKNGAPVAKTRLAVEELHKLKKNNL